MNAEKEKYATLDIEGTIFEVDIQQDLIRQKDLPGNGIYFQSMEYMGPHYQFIYDKSIKSQVDSNSLPWDVVLAKVPEKVSIDPEAMAKKHNLDIVEIMRKSDFEIIVDQQLFKERLDYGTLPVIDVASRVYFVDIRCHQLRSTTDSTNSVDLRKQYVDEYGDYHTFFDKDEQRFINIDKHIGSLDNIIYVKFPPDCKMDPYRFAIMKNLNVKDYLMKNRMLRDIKVKVSPAAQSFAKDMVKINEQSLLKKKKISAEGMKRPHL